MAVTYAEVQENPDLFQEYLDDFCRRFPSRYVQRLVYTSQHDFKFVWGRELYERGLLSSKVLSSLEQGHCSPVDLFGLGRENVLASVPFINQVLGKRIPHPIVIFPLALKMDERSLYVTLVGHEYVHAEDMSNGIPLSHGKKLTSKNIRYLDPDFVADFIELRANIHQRSFSYQHFPDLGGDNEQARKEYYDQEIEFWYNKVLAFASLSNPLEKVVIATAKTLMN
ncbi:MAG: hypothetical protein Q7R96_00780 [Nanoarchaeota archaeon]|nr:hypothetical protein [Nanoarchaeota archaeon]